MPGKKSRNKGYRGEHEAETLLVSAGVRAKRVPCSGAVDQFKEDIWLIGENGGFTERIEVKYRESVPICIYKWKGEADYLFMRRNRMPWVVCMELDRFIELKKAEGFANTDIKKVVEHGNRVWTANEDSAYEKAAYKTTEEKQK